MSIRNGLWVGGILLITALAYLDTHDAGFVTDFTGLAERIETHGARGIIYSFGFPALQPLLSAVYYVLYHAFGTTGWGWWAAGLGVHLLNAFLLYSLLQRLLSSPGSEVIQWIAVVGSLLFLWSPYASEVLVWRVCLNYLLVTSGIIGSLICTVAWLERPARRWWYRTLGLQLAALLIFELALIIPLLSLVMILWYTRPVAQLRRALVRLWLPQLALVLLYFVANRLWLGNWIGHYGAEVHWRFPLSEMTANLGQYLIKWAAFSRYWPHGWKEGVAAALSNGFATGMLIAVLLIGGYVGVRYFRRYERREQTTWVLSLMSLIALLPVLNLYFNYLLHIENDRYGYLAAAFFYPALVALLSKLPRGWFRLVLISYVIVSLVLLWRTNRYWTESTVVYRSLLSDFAAYDRDTVYLLNLPDNLQGAPMFRDYSGQDRAFADALRYVAGKDYQGTWQEVVQYNMVRPQDGVEVAIDSAGIQVTFLQWGNWWWRRGIGASDYRDSTYRFDNAGHHYRLDWRRTPRDAAVLYQVGDQWREVRLDREGSR